MYFPYHWTQEPRYPKPETLQVILPSPSALPNHLINHKIPLTLPPSCFLNLSIHHPHCYFFMLPLAWITLTVSWAPCPLFCPPSIHSPKAPGKLAGMQIRPSVTPQQYSDHIWFPWLSIQDPKWASPCLMPQSPLSAALPALSFLSKQALPKRNMTGAILKGKKG